jgi:hypothetical protein
VLVVFLAAALLGSRNVPVAALVLVPMLAAAWPEVGSLRADGEGFVAGAASALAIAALLVVCVVRLGEPAYDLRDYPLRSLDHLLDHHVALDEVHMAAPDQVGNLLELRDGPGRSVFYDDRFDMFPTAVTDDVVALTQGAPSALHVLDRRHIDLVLWRRALPLTQILRASPAWRVLFNRDEQWVLLCRDGADLGGDLGPC